MMLTNPRTKPIDRRTTAPQVRAGFSLLELLIVIGIIIFLLSIAVTVFANFIRSAKVNQTAATIAKIQSIMDQRIEAFNKQNFTAAARKIAAASGGTLNERTALIFAKKQAFRQAFPQTLKDFGGTVPAPFSKITVAEDTSLAGNYVSSALLYLALTEGPTFGAPAVDADTFRSSELSSTPSGATKYFVDAWGNPLRFYRWPTRLFRFGEDRNGDGSYTPGTDLIDVDGDTKCDPEGNGLIPSGNPPPSNADYWDPEFRNPVFRTLASQLIAGLPPQRSAQDPAKMAGVFYGPDNSDPQDPLAKDPDDPLGLLVAINGTTLARNSFENTWHTISTYHVPLIISAGPDSNLGLYEPNDATPRFRLAMPKDDVFKSSVLFSGTRDTSSEPLTDNITNLNQRSGGN